MWRRNHRLAEGKESQEVKSQNKKDDVDSRKKGGE